MKFFYFGGGFWGGGGKLTTTSPFSKKFNHSPTTVLNSTFGLEVVDIDFGSPTQEDVHDESSRVTIGSLILVGSFSLE